MSTPANQLPSQQQPPTTGQLPPVTISAAPESSNQEDQTDASLFAGLQNYEKSLQQMSDIEKQQAQSTQQEEQQVQQLQPPQRQGMLSSFPLLLALTAIGGKASGLSGRVMLGALAGAANGVVQGNEKAFNDGIKQYEAQRQKLQDLYTLQQQYYNELYKAFGATAEGQMQAIQMVRQITKDEIAQQNAAAKLHLNEVDSFERSLALQEKISQDNKTNEFKQANLDLQRQKLQFTKSQAEANVPSDAALKTMVQTYFATGKIPSFGWGQSGMLARTKFYNMIPVMANNIPGGIKTIMAQQANYHALSSALKEVQDRSALINTNEESAEKQAGLVSQSSLGYPRTGMPIINRAINLWNTYGISNPQAARFANAIMVFSNEYAKVMTGQTSGQPVSDAARHEAQKIMSDIMSGQTIDSVMQQEIQSMNNRKIAFQDQESSIMTLLSSVNSSASVVGNGSVGAPPGGYSNKDEVMKAFKEGKITNTQAAQIMNDNGWIP